MHIIKVCTGVACKRNFGDENLKRAEKILGIKAGENKLKGSIQLENSGCLGHCEHAPNVYFGEASPISMLINDGKVEKHILPNKLEEKLKKLTFINSKYHE